MLWGALHARSCTLRQLSSGRGWQHGAAAGSQAPTRRQCRPRTPLRTLASTSDKIDSTLAGLDAILGIDSKKEEEEARQREEQQQQAAAAASAQQSNDVSISPDVLKAIAEAESKRLGGTGEKTSAAYEEQLRRLTEQARKIRDGESKDDTPGDAALRREWEQLAAMLGQGQLIDHEDVKVIKEDVFKRTAFWVTEAKALPGYLGGILVRGNIKGAPETVFGEVCTGTKQVLGDKYIVRMVPDPVAMMEEDYSPPTDGPPRVAFEFLPAATCQPPEMARWQRVAAAVLLLLTLGSTFQLALGANIGLLPKETLVWLADPANLDVPEGFLPPGLENYDPVPFLQSLGDVCLVTLLPQLAHELGHSVAAAVKKLRIGASFLIPNSQLGTFGSVTQLKSYARNRTDLFDFAVSGLGAGALVSLGLYVAGIVLSQGGSTAEPGLIPVPSQLFQGSLFLGGLARLAFGADVVSNAQVYVHPMLIGGWCGLVATAFNSLPAGNLDGGRSFLASFGRNGLAVSSVLTYIGLGLSLLGSSLAWPFGIYLLVCQREAEKYVQDEVSGVSERRQAISAALVVFALLVLLPMAPEVADTVGVGTPANFL